MPGRGLGMYKKLLGKDLTEFMRKDLFKLPKRSGLLLISERLVLTVFLVTYLLFFFFFTNRLVRHPINSSNVSIWREREGE